MVMRRLWVVVGLLMTIVGARAQEMPPQADSIDYYFRYQQALVPERLYLTLDRPYYEAGDTVWFRGTLVAAENGSYLLKSNYIYVELRSRDGDGVLRRKVRRDGLCFHHCLPLPVGMATGEYTLCAYTSWMRNFPAEGFFNRKLTIINRNEPAAPDEPTTPDYEVSFFPEGGPMIARAEQQVAYKAVASDGLPVAVGGRVSVGRRGNVVATFTAADGHDGMGAFRLPEMAVGDSVWCEITPVDDVLPVKTYALPVAERGVALAIDSRTAGRVTGHVIASPGITGDYELLLHSGPQLVARRSIAPGGTFDLDLTACGDGVSHLVLVTAEGIGVSRRLLFHRDAARAVGGRVAAVWKPSEPRGHVSLRVAVSDAEGHPLRGDYCMSVVDMGYVNVGIDSLRDNLVTNFLLTGDLRGYVHRPAWYFAATDAADSARRDAALDLVMMTHGWCRFATDTLAREPRISLPHPLEEREWLSGRVKHLRKKDAAAPLSVVDTTGGSFGSGRIEQDGTFFIGDLDYPDGAVLNIRLLSKGANPQFLFDRYESPAVVAREPWHTAFSTYIAERGGSELMIGRDGMRTVLLSDIEVVDRRKSRAPQFRGVATERYHDADYIEENYNLYQYDDALTLVNEMIEREWSMYIDPIDPFGDFAAANGTAQSSRLVTNGWGDLRTFVIGGQTYTGADAAIGILERTPSVDVERVEIIDHSLNLINPNSGSAALVVILKPGSKLRDGTDDRRRVTHRAFGYTPPAYFYRPVYATEEQRRAAFEPDLRKTVHWEPAFQTDRTGAATVEFYNSDHTGPRRVVVEGVTFGGRPVRVEQVIE